MIPFHFSMHSDFRKKKLEKKAPAPIEVAAVEPTQTTARKKPVKKRVTKKAAE